MRGFLLSLALATLVAWAAPAGPAEAVPVLTSAAPVLTNAAPAYALQIPDKKIKITIGDADAHWYRNPVWIAIGALAAVVLVLLIIVARHSTIRD